MNVRTTLITLGSTAGAAALVAGTAGIAHAAVIHGNDSANTLKGTSGNDAIYGYGGNDSLHGYEGNDTLVGENNDDRIYGGAGRDYIKGGYGNDYIHAGPTYMDDTVYGGPGNDYVYWAGHPTGYIDCGSGYDTVSVIDKPRLVSCEKVVWR